MSYETMLILLYSLVIRHTAAFQAVKNYHTPQTKQRLHCEKDVHLNSDLDDSRRAFVRNHLVVLLVLPMIMAPKRPVLALETDNIWGDQVVTTPSVVEGELIASEAPPNRAKEVAAVAPEVKRRKQADPRFFIAGGASAAISHGITTPIDVVKTRMQSEAALSGVSPTEAALKIVEDEGPNALTVGLGPTVVGYGIEGALKFGVYESLKPLFLSLLRGTSDGQAFLAAAVCAGAMASIILCPMEETRIRLVTDPHFGRGLVDGLPKLFKEKGIFSPFIKGMPPMLAKQVPYTMGKQVSFDLFAGMLYTLLAGLSFVPQKEIALEVEVGAAFLASIVACLSSHPGDVLLTETYRESDGSNGSHFISTIKRVYSERGGFSAFFSGINARFVHVGCIITCQLVIYDQIKQAMGLPASGS